MQREILQAHPEAKLRVYAIWTSKQLGDARDRWDGAGLTDPRVVHLWDEPDASGQWLARNQPGYQGPDWDTWLLYDARATWTPTAPPTLRGSGYTVADTIAELDGRLAPLLAS